MWVKFRLSTSDKWQYDEYPEEIFSFADDDELGDRIWDDHYDYQVAGCLVFDRIDAPPKEEIRKLISYCWRRVASAVQDIEKYEKMLKQ